MILTLLFVSVMIIGIVACLIGSYVKARAWSRDDGKYFRLDSAGEALQVSGCVVAIVVGIGAFFSLVGIITNQNSAYARNLKIDYEQQVVQLSSTREAIIVMRDDYAKSVATTTYNAEVKEFKTKILQSQEMLRNPWISWFIPSVYGNFDANVVSYIE